MGTYILTIIYVVAFLANITSEIVYYKRYENFKKSLGYINLKGNKFCEFFLHNFFIGVPLLLGDHLLLINFFDSINSNVNFNQQSLKDLKEELSKGDIKLADVEELHPIELVHKIKGARKSLIASYEEYIEELLNLLYDYQDTNYFSEPDKTDLNEKKAELKQLQIRFDTAIKKEAKSKK